MLLTQNKTCNLISFFDLSGCSRSNVEMISHFKTECAPAFHFHFCSPYHCPKKQASSTVFFILTLLPWTARQCSAAFVLFSGNTCIFCAKLRSSDSLTLHQRDKNMLVLKLELTALREIY